MPCFKVPIKSLLKPIPKVIKRRRRKKKNETLTSPSTIKNPSTIKAGTQEVQPEEKENNTKDDATSNENVSSPVTILVSASTDNKNKESAEPEVQTQTASTNLETDNEKDNIGEKSSEEDSSSKNMEENELQETPDLITSNETSPTLNTLVTVTSIIGKAPQETKVIDISKDVEVVVEKTDSCTEKTAIVLEGSKIISNVPGEQDKSEDRPIDKETQECDNIPVLRIIEALDDGTEVRDNILSTVVVERSITETIAEKEAVDHDMLQSKLTLTEEKVISKESVVPLSEKQLIEETVKISNSSITETETNISEIAQIESSSKTKISETDKSVCEVPAEGLVRNNESKDKQQKDNTVNITAPALSKEKINNQKEKEAIRNSSPDVSHQKDAEIIYKDQSSTTNASALVECHNLSSICDVSNSYPATVTSIAKAKENEVPSSSNEMSVALSQKVEPRPLETLSLLPDKVLHDVVPLTPITSSSKQREESYKTGANNVHKSILDSTETVTTDKISECIARSIDLIDANDSELMALGEHWEDSGASPKSISPTQIFLNIFPLLPRESSINEQHHSQSTHQISQNPPTSTFQPTSKNILPFMPSSNSRSSFFIDAMLPDDHAPSTSTETTDPISTSLPTSHSPFLPLTPPQYSSLAPTSQQISSPFSLSSNYYWTPQTIPSSSCTDTNFMDYRNTSNVNIFSLDESQRSSISSSTISSALTLTTTSTFTPVTSVKSSTVPTVSTSSSVTTPILSTASKTKSKNSENHSTSSNKRQKTESTGKLAFVADTNLPTFSKDKKTKTSVTISTSTNVTWTGTSTTSTSLTLNASSFQQNAAQNVSAVPAIESSMSHSSTTPVSSTSQKIPYHSCSLLDALNPMDASFFRPLINALDSHDFRSLDFPGGNSLPPPPLPPLITPSTKSLYSSHINPTPQPVQNSSINPTSYSNHQHSLLQPNQPIQMFSSNVPLASSSRSHPDISSHGSKHQHHSKPMQQYQSVSLSSQQESRPPPSSKSTKPQSSNVPNSGTEKTSRTSGRQKHESKQGRSGKSSRTQPYITPSSTPQATTDQKQSKKQDHVAPTVTPKATRTHSFHTIHSHIHPSTDLSSSSSRSYDFHNIQSQSSNKISNPVKVKPSNSDKTATAPMPRIQAPKSSESKTQKSKDQKAQPSHSSHNVKQPSRSLQSSFSIAQQIPSHSQTSSSNSLKNTVSHASAKVNLVGVHQTNFSRPNLEAEASKSVSVQPIQTPISSGLQPTAQLQQSSGESISLFPEFSTIGTNCNTSRQFAGGQSHAPQYYNHDTSSMQQQPEQPPSASSFPIQRTQPYYFPDISSFENFPAVHHNQNQPQLPLVTQQVHQPSLSRQAVAESSNNYGQNQSHVQVAHETVNNSPKCTYGSNLSTATNSNQPEFQHSHVQHQPTMRPHQNYFMHQDTYHHNQQPTIQHHTATLVQPSESQRHQPQFPICQQQVQQQPSRNHAHHPHSNTSTATTSTTTSVSSGKEKQHHSTPSAPAMAFHSHTTSQQQQPPHHQQVSHLQQNLPQPTNRTSSKTVNWMTDTGYRSNSSASAAANKQQRQSTVGVTSTSNPFSVSKLVGNTSGAVPSKVQQAPSTRNASGIANSSKNQQHQSIASHNINASTHNTTTRQNKSSRNNTSSNSSTAGTSTTPVHSQNQSNYCAEALIRKNPPVAAATNDWMNDFNLVSSTNQNFHGSNYTDSHHHSSSHIHTQHHQNQNTATENFPGSYTSNICGGTYHYQAAAASSTPSSNASHFPHFDQVQPQYNMTHHRTHHHHQPQHAVQTSTSTNYDHGQQRLHNSPAHSSQPHDMQINAANQMHYPQQHQQHHHPQIHLSNQHPQTHSTSSSVTNFNLSTIFPEINDKRGTNNSSNSLGAQVQGGSTSSGNNNNSNAGGSRNINSAFGYQHSSFGSSTEGPGNMQ